VSQELQLHVVLPYNIEVRKHPRVQSYLTQGYRIEEVQRISDREALVTLRCEPAPAS